MKYTKMAGLAIVLAAMALAIGGCKDQEQQIIELQAEYNTLSAQNANLRSQLAKSKDAEAGLLSEVDKRSLALTARQKELARLQAELDQKPEVEPVGARGDWEIGRYADRVTVGSDILFDAGRAKLTSKGKAAMDNIARDLNSTYRGMPIRVYGYTDADPIKRSKKLWKDNLDLSANRSMAVTRHLIGKGINPENIETVGMGATNFIAPNDTRANKTKNRRVEIIVIKK